jgi:aryl-alcohol dehydrogenase-like predicted oxidoreductase
MGSSSPKTKDTPPLPPKKDFAVSKIGLGTVEIGLPYGIGIKKLPTDKEAENVLKSAIELGITYIDTARGYGVAEERIGKFGITKIPGVIVGTKCAQFLEKGADPRGPELEQLIRREVEDSLTNLHLDSLPLLQLHGGTKKQIERGELTDIMRRLIEEGKVQQVGIATRGEDAPLAAINSDLFSTIQTAYSIFDQRMSPHVLPQAQDKKISIICRSVLLKGTLTPAAQNLPPELKPLKEASQTCADIAQELGTDLPSLAFRFVLSNPAITTALVGTINPDHLKTALQAAQASPLPPAIINKLENLAIHDVNLIDPAHWPPVN